MRAKKRLGQHFLHSTHVIEKLVNHINPAEGEALLEIGPGQGVLTEPLLQRGAKLTAIEIDDDLIDGLRDRFVKYKHFHLIHQDILDADLDTILHEKMTIVGNLPYNISTPILFTLLPYRHKINRCYFMLQKEVVSRLAATPGTKDYGRLTIMIQNFFKVRSLFDVPPGAFSPPPKVNSAIVELIPLENSDLKILSPEFFAAIVRVAFSYRRKTLSNAIKEFTNAESLIKHGVNPQARPETLSPTEWVRLANALYEDKMAP